MLCKQSSRIRMNPISPPPSLLFNPNTVSKGKLLLASETSHCDLSVSQPIRQVPFCFWPKWLSRETKTPCYQFWMSLDGKNSTRISLMRVAGGRANTRVFLTALVSPPSHHYQLFSALGSPFGTNAMTRRSAHFQWHAFSILKHSACSARRHHPASNASA